MKKKNKKNQIRMRLSKILFCCLAIVLCTTPALHALETVPAGATWDIDYAVTEILLYVYGIANLQPPGASAQYIYVQNGGTLNMYSGTIGSGCFINVGSIAAGMTIYGTEFEVDGYPCEYGEVTLTRGRGTLTGEYGDESSIDLWIFNDNPINLQPPPSSGPEEIQIDIKPGGNPNNINLKSKGVVPVAILSTETFNASNVDPESVTFAGAEPVRWKLENVDEDDVLDMLFHFKTEDLRKDDENKKGLDDNSTEATLTATLIDTSTKTMGITGGEVIQGTDEVCIKPGKNKK